MGVRASETNLAQANASAIFNSLSILRRLKIDIVYAGEGTESTDGRGQLLALREVGGEEHEQGEESPECYASQNRLHLSPAPTFIPY